MHIDMEEVIKMMSPELEAFAIVAACTQSWSTDYLGFT